jgi:hypothetical protein
MFVLFALTILLLDQNTVDNGDTPVSNIANFSILSNRDKNNYARGDITWYFMCGIMIVRLT